jgi:hypothetical protein
LGSGGPALLTDNGSSQIVGGGKYGRLYLLTTASLGGYSATGNDSNAWQFIPGLRDGVTNGTHSIYCTPAYWNGMVFLQPQNDVLRAFAWNGRLSSAPVATSSQTFGDHGATPSISANGNSNAIVWVLQVDHWSTGGPAVLHAYDALNVAHELYSSSQAGSRDTAGPAVKFAVATVVN